MFDDTRGIPIPIQIHGDTVADDDPETDKPGAAEQLSRLQADFSRYRQRIARERQGDRRQAENAVVEQLLPVIDNFERGLDAADRDRSSSHVEGFALIYRQLLAALAALGIEPLQSVGEAFDPHLHESVMQEASDTVPPDTVIRELQKGYVRDGEVIRHARVVVSSVGGKDES